jgi:hypothetical protein
MTAASSRAIRRSRRKRGARQPIEIWFQDEPSPRHSKALRAPEPWFIPPRSGRSTRSPAAWRSRPTVPSSFARWNDWGKYVAAKHRVPRNVTLLPLPPTHPCSLPPILRLAQDLWRLMRGNWLPGSPEYEPGLQLLRRHPRPPVLHLEQAHRHAPKIHCRLA